MRLNPQAIDRYDDNVIAVFDNIPQDIEDKRGFLKYAADNGVDSMSLGDPALVAGYRNQQKTPAMRVPAGPVASAAPPPPKPIPASSYHAITQRNIAAGSKYTPPSDIINPVDRLGVNPVAMQMRSIRMSGSGIAADNPYVADPAIVGSAARKFNEAIRDPKAYGTMSAAEMAAIEPLISNTPGGKSFINRRNSKVATETERITRELNDPAKPITSVAEFNSILNTVDPIARAVILADTNKFLPETLRAQLQQEQSLEMQGKVLRDLNAPYYMGAAEGLGYTEAQVRSFIENPNTPEAEAFFSQYVSDPQNPQYVYSEGGPKFIAGEKPAASKLRSPYLSLDVTNPVDAKSAVEFGAKQSDVAVAAHEFKSNDQVVVPKIEGSAGTSRTSATAIDSAVTAAQRRIQEGDSPDDAVDAAVGGVRRSGDFEPGDAESYLAFRGEVIKELRERSRLSIERANASMNAADAAELGGFVNSFGTYDQFTGKIDLTDKVADLSQPARIAEAARFAQAFDESGFKTAADYLISAVGTDPDGKFADYIRRVSSMDPGARAAHDPVLSAVIDRVIANKQAGDSYNAAVQMEQEKAAQQRDIEFRQKEEQRHEMFRKSYPASQISRENFNAQTTELSNGRYLQFATPELKAVFDSADDETKGFIQKSLPISSSGLIGGGMDPATIKAFTAGARGAYNALFNEPTPLVIPDGKGGTVMRGSSVPMLTDTGLAQMRASIEASTKEMRSQLAAKDAARMGQYTALGQYPSVKTAIPKELEAEMAPGSRWGEMYARGIEEGMKSGDFRKAEAAYLGARSERIAQRSQSFVNYQDDIVDRLRNIAESIGAEMSDDERSSPKAINRAIATRVAQVMDDGRIDPSELRVIDVRMLDEAIGVMKEARNLAKADADAIESLGSSPVRVSRDSRGNVLAVTKADIGAFDSVIRTASELRESIGAVTEAGLIQTTDGIPPEITGEVERRFNNPTSFEPNWREMAKSRALTIASDAVYSAIGEEPPVYSEAVVGPMRVTLRGGRGDFDRYQNLIEKVSTSAGVDRAQAKAIVDKKIAEASRQAEADTKLRIANRVLRSTAKDERKRAMTAEEEARQRRNREILMGVSS